MNTLNMVQMMLAMVILVSLVMPQLAQAKVKKNETFNRPSVSKSKISRTC